MQIVEEAFFILPSPFSIYHSPFAFLLFSSLCLRASVVYTPFGGRIHAS